MKYWCSVEIQYKASSRRNPQIFREKRIKNGHTIELHGMAHLSLIVSSKFQC